MTKPPVTPPRLRRWDIVLLVGLCLATLLYGVGNLSLRPAQHDGFQNLEMGIELGRKPNHPRHYREPFIPAVIAAITLAQRALGYEPVADSCVDRNIGRAKTVQCRLAYAPYKILNVVFVLVAGIGVFFLCRWYVAVRWLPYFAFLLVTQSLIGVWSFDNFYTEVPAAALLVIVSCLGVLTLVRRRVLYSALLGLTLAALVLTKVVFLYFWPFVVASLVASDLRQRTLRRRTVLLVGVFLIAHFLPLSSWMARNFILFDDFSVVDIRRSVSVSILRATYNTMRDDEFAAGFWYYAPYRIDFGIPKQSWERLDVKNPDGFRQTGRRAKSRYNSADRSRRKMQEREMSMAGILADPWQHLKISSLMAWRGLFTQSHLGYYDETSHIHLLTPRSLPRGLLPAAMAVVRGGDHVVWIRGREGADGYGGADLKELLNLETVAEFPDATLYRMSPPVNRMPSPNDSVRQAARAIPVPVTSASAAGCEDWTSKQFFADASVEEVVACLNAGANPNARNESGATALHLAARFNPSGAVIRALVDAGADLHLRDNAGRAPVHLAAWQNPSVAVIKALIDAGADLSMPNDRGWTPLNLAARSRSEKVFEALLGAGAVPAGAEPGSNVVVSEFLEDIGADAVHWADPSGMLYHFRNRPVGSEVWSNHVQSLPSTMVTVPRLTEVWSLDSWPRWRWKFDPLLKTLVNLVGFLALLVVPLWFCFGRRSRRIEVMFVMLPALYMHAVYAVASHFIHRYAVPEIPLRILAVLLLVSLAASSLRRLGARRASAKRPSPPAGHPAAGLRTQGRGGSLPARLRRKAGRW